MKIQKLLVAIACLAGLVPCVASAAVIQLTPEVTSITAGAAGIQDKGTVNLNVGDTLLIELDISRQEGSAGDSWFGFGIDSPGWPHVNNGQFGGLVRTRTDSAGANETFDTTAGDGDHFPDTTDSSMGLRVQIANNGEAGKLDFLYQVDNDNDGSYDVGDRGQFNAPDAMLNVDFSALGKNHNYTVLDSQAVEVITDLFNTGEGDNGIALGGGVDDPHYELTTDPSGAGDATVSSIPGAWVDNDGDSRWIGPDTTSNASAIGGTYTYETTFTLDNLADLSTAQITGRWGTDNPGTDIRLNGVSVGAGQLSTGFGSLTAFKIDSTAPFVHGVNILEFDVFNAPGTPPAANPTGLRVEDIVGTYQTVIPEPSTYLVFGGLMLCFGIAGWWRKRRQAT